MQQLALDMALPPSFAADDIAVTPANASLIGLIDAAPELLGAGLLLIGPNGSGKTHLAWRWAQRHGAVFLPPEQIGVVPAEQLLQGRTRVVIDPIERIGHWSGLVALMNEVRAKGGQVLATAEEALSIRPVPLPDAQSRLQGLTQHRIPDPDDALLEAHLRKRFSDWHWQLDPAVMDFLLPRLPRDYGALQDWLNHLRQRMAETPKRLTIPLVRTHLTDWENEA